MKSCEHSGQLHAKVESLHCSLEANSRTTRSTCHHTSRRSSLESSYTPGFRNCRSVRRPLWLILKGRIVAGVERLRLRLISGGLSSGLLMNLNAPRVQLSMARLWQLNGIEMRMEAWRGTRSIKVGWRLRFSSVVEVYPRSGTPSMVETHIESCISTPNTCVCRK